MYDKLDFIQEKYQELSLKVSDPDVIADQANWQKYAKELEPQLLQADPKHVFVTHSGCSDSIVQALVDYLESLNHFEEVHVTVAGGVISSHCGPETLGILFYAE